jgi:hypothetical protein
MRCCLVLPKYLDTGNSADVNIMCMRFVIREESSRVHTLPHEQALAPLLFLESKLIWHYCLSSALESWALCRLKVCWCWKMVWRLGVNSWLAVEGFPCLRDFTPGTVKLFWSLLIISLRPASSSDQLLVWSVLWLWHAWKCLGGMQSC